MCRFFALIVVAGLVCAACGGGSKDGAPAGGSVSEDELRTALQGMLHAALNGDVDGFSAYLASSCEGGDDIVQGVGLLRSLLGGLGAEGEISVEVPEVEYDVVDANHVTVTGLPDLRVVVSDQPPQGGVATGIANVSLKLVREGLAWRIESCKG